jgi:translocation and assembly module TamA
MAPAFEDVRYGAGLGGRYYPGFGPIRLDVATPLDPRAQDEAVQVYISIGQAF